MLKSYLQGTNVVTTKQAPDQTEYVVYSEPLGDYLAGWFNLVNFELIGLPYGYRKCPVKAKGGIPVPTKRSRFI